MIFITGDTHGSQGMKRLSNKNFPQNKIMNKKDYVIITGDFGGVWNLDREDQWWLKWLKERNFTTLFVDGNHENFDLLEKYPVTEWNGGKVHFINDSVIHLMRGQVYTIEDKKIFTFGGADSIDKLERKEHIDWWKQEMPSYAEYNEGFENLDKHNWEVDIVISHTCSISMFNQVKEHIDGFEKELTQIEKFFEEIETNLKFNHWYFGHFHKDIKLDEKHTVLYKNFIKIN